MSGEGGWWLPPGLMIRRSHAQRFPTPTAAGAGLCIAGFGFIGMGLWGRRETRLGLARERVVGPADTPVADPAAARSMAEFVRESTLRSTRGRTYSETEPYVDAAGEPTPDAALAAKHELTGQPLENPDHELWIQSTTLQTALLQAYMAFRLAELTIAIGSAFVLAGLGLTAADRRGH